MNKYAISGALSATGLILIAIMEGFSPTPYKDAVGIPTDGFGNTHNVGKNKTVPQHLEQLNRNATVAGLAVSRCITKPMTQGNYDAFVSFTFNVGEGAFCKSTLVKKFNAGDTAGACNELTRWVYAGGKKLPGLVARREKEKELCLS
jgi:lysozyme